ncbi:hypothetical protein BGZ73_002152 [Actinomortierella ambigua]|nr:hypothetical protein BGZ73_002152 [Actinomortierella ambigua]
MATQPGHPRADLGQAVSPSPPPTLSPSSPHPSLPPPPPPPPSLPVSSLSERPSQGDDSAAGTTPANPTDHIPTATTLPSSPTTISSAATASAPSIQNTTLPSITSTSSSSPSSTSSEQPLQVTIIPGRATIKKRQRLNPAEPVIRPVNPYSHTQGERRTSTGHQLSTNNASSLASSSPPAAPSSKARTMNRRLLETMTPLKDFYWYEQNNPIIDLCLPVELTRAKLKPIAA